MGGGGGVKPEIARVVSNFSNKKEVRQPPIVGKTDAGEEVNISWPWDTCCR